MWNLFDFSNRRLFNRGHLTIICEKGHCCCCPNQRLSQTLESREDSQMNSLSPTTTTLGEYKLGKTIGQGAFSKVKLAIHNETGQKVQRSHPSEMLMIVVRYKNHR